MSYRTGLGENIFPLFVQHGSITSPMFMFMYIPDVRKESALKDDDFY